VVSIIISELTMAKLIRFDDGMVFDWRDTGAARRAVLIALMTGLDAIRKHGTRHAIGIETKGDSRWRRQQDRSPVFFVNSPSIRETDAVVSRCLPRQSRFYATRTKSVVHSVRRHAGPGAMDVSRVCNQGLLEDPPQ